MADERSLKYATIQYRNAVMAYRKSVNTIFDGRENGEISAKEFLTLNELDLEMAKRRKNLLMVAIEYDGDILEEHLRKK